MFTVGQQVWCVIFGEGVVSRLVDGPFSVEVKFLNDEVEPYTSTGHFFHRAGNQTLFPYPVKISRDESVATKPSINWGHVSPEYNYLAQDESGTCWVYEHVPILIEDEWASSRGDCTPADCLQSLVPGTCSWIDSLVERPK